MEKPDKPDATLAHVDVRRELITDHPFTPSIAYPAGEGCAFEVCGSTWTIADPHRCRRPESEHATSLRRSAERPASRGREEKHGQHDNHPRRSTLGLRRQNAAVAVNVKADVRLDAIAGHLRFAGWCYSER